MADPLPGTWHTAGVVWHVLPASKGAVVVAVSTLSVPFTALHLVTLPAPLPATTASKSACSVTRSEPRPTCASGPARASCWSALSHLTATDRLPHRATDKKPARARALRQSGGVSVWGP